MDNSLIDILIRIYIIAGILFCVLGFIYTTFFSEGEDVKLKNDINWFRNFAEYVSNNNNDVYNEAIEYADKHERSE